MMIVGVSVLVMSGATASASIVQTVEQSPTEKSKTWQHRVTEAGEYQIGQAWVHILKGDKLRVEILVNGKPVKTHNFERGKKIEPYDAPLFRFQLRLEELKSGDKVRVTCTPEAKTEYELEYKLAFGTPTFKGMKVFTLKRFGAKADGKHNDLPALWKATAAAVKAGGGIIRFEKNKTYRLKVERPEAVKKKQYVFQLQGNKNIKFEGNGAKLVLHPEKLAFISLEDCENIQIDHLTQTFDPQPYYQGKLLRVDPEAMTADIEVPKRYGLPLVGKQRHGHIFCRSHSDPIFDEGVAPGYIRSEHLYFDSTEILKKGSKDIPTLVRIHFNKGSKVRLPRMIKNGAEGNPMVMPHIKYGHYEGGHASIKGSGRISLTKVWIQSMANMGIIPSHNWGPITFTKTDLKTPNPETERFVSWRDGFHVRDNRMGIMIEDGYYDGGMVYDDIFSPHSMLNKVEKIVNHPDGRMEVSLYGLSPKEMYQPGDWISAWDPKQVKTGKGIARVVKVVENSSAAAPGANHRFRILLDRKVGLQIGDYSFNEETINWDMVIRRCTHSDVGKMGTTRWRTPVLIEDCNFKNITMHIYAADGYTVERPRPRHIEIRNSLINEKMNFRCTDAWNVSITDSTIDSTAVTGFRNTPFVTYNNVTWKNAPKKFIGVKNGTGIVFKGDCRVNGSKEIKTGISFSTTDNFIAFPDGSTVGIKPAGKVSGTVFVTLTSPGYEESGHWQQSGLGGFQGAKTRHTLNGKATFTSALKKKGSYQVWIYRVSHQDNDLKQPIVIKHNGETETIIVNMQEGPSGWLSLGSFYFKASGEESIMIKNRTPNFRIRTSALKLVPED